jgi:hypothetical protein
LEVTGLVVTGKVAVVAPAGTVTVAGTWAAAVIELVNATAAPPAGAGPLSVTVPVEGLAPTTEVGISVTEFRTGADTVVVTVKVVDRLTLL